MPSLLIRDMSEATKQRLAVQAAENGRSQQAEAIAILEETLHSSQTPWFENLLQISQEVGGIDLPVIERHSPRVTVVLL